MRRAAFWVTVSLIVCLAAVAPADALTPVPAKKPLSAHAQRTFVEGVDIPLSKPALMPEERMVLKRSDVTRAECIIPGGLVERLEPFTGALEGSPMDDDACGIPKPVKLAGIKIGKVTVRFPSPVTLSCGFAQTLAEWLKKDVLPAADKSFGSTELLLGSGPGYQCRRRNNRPEGKLSEHALGKALDISYFQLSDGSKVSVEEDWPEKTANGRFLKQIHTSACKRFSTVLGPDADPNHKSHFHLDIGCHGKDCTYLICQ